MVLSDLSRRGGAFCLFFLSAFRTAADFGLLG